MFQPSDAIARVQAASLRSGNRPGLNVVSLAMGEPDFDTPEEVTAAAVDALHAGYTHYALPMGDEELRAALAAHVSRVAGVRYAAEQIVITHGGTAGLSATILATVNPGDRVVIPEPSYSLYADLVRMVGGMPVFVPTLPDYHLDLERIAEAVVGARLLVLCNPCNPTGAVYSADELKRLAELLDGSETLLLSDEAYDTIVYDGRKFNSALSIASLQPRLVYCQTLSKAYAMTGWRIGYVAAPSQMIGSIALAHRTLNGSANAAVQRAALAAVRLGPEASNVMLDAYARRRALVAREIASIPGLSGRPPEGTFYAFVRYDLEMPARELTARLLEGGVAVRPGSEFGPSGEGHLRLSFAASEEQILEGFARLRAVLQAQRASIAAR